MATSSINSSTYKSSKQSNMVDENSKNMEHKLCIANTCKDYQHLLIHYKLNLKKLCLCTVWIPSITLIFCFTTAWIFQFKDVHEDHCKVFNIIPSISAVTGISPQNYIWRISMSLHSGPRLLICIVYNAYQLNLINSKAPEQIKSNAKFWLNLAYTLNIIETAALCGVTYISNRENYPMHEKLFITFMVSSLGHMIAFIQGTKLAAETRNDLGSVKEGLKYKFKILVLSLICTATLLGFYLLHKYFCLMMAFSIFSLSEYIIAGANVAFHISVIKDFPNEDLIVGKIVEDDVSIGNGDHHRTKTD